MKKFITITFYLLLALSINAQVQHKKIGDFIESTNYNESKRGSERLMQYFPDGNDFVCYNGKNRFTRALYGGYTDFRLETSDMPVFATYKKNNYRNIQLSLNGVPLDKVEYCEARYCAGMRHYTLSDSRWKGGKLNISAVVATDVEKAILSFETVDFLEKAEMEVIVSEIAIKKLSRNGDMGVEKPGCFEAGKELERQKWDSNGPTLLTFEISGTETLVKINEPESAMLFNKAMSYSDELSSRISFVTPDPYINTLGAALTTAAEGIWDGNTWLHGSIGWRMPLAGWRAGYTGDLLGWNDRAIRHFDAYAASQITDIAPKYSHPSQDSVLCLARAEKKWGTQMYSNGYISSKPNAKDKMNHYDMNLNFIDELLWHFCYDADVDYMRKMWPLLKLHLQWEKRNFDPDNDGLYDAYCCIWASDALYYNSGAVTHSSAYNLRAFRMAARIAEILGEDASWFRQEAEKIQKALNSRLWLKDQGVWAEYQDFMGLKRKHEVPAIWTIYTAVDCGAGSHEQNKLATQWMLKNIPQIPIRWKTTTTAAADSVNDEGLYTISTSSWTPYSWSINNVAGAEVMHAALACFEAGRNDEGFRLMKGNIMDNMYLGESPGNFGQLSFYDAARGECYRDFGDVVGISARTLIQGLFGIVPDALNGKCYIRPGMPNDWTEASVSTPYINYTYQKDGDKVTLWIEQNFTKPLQIIVLNADNEIIGTDALEQSIEYVASNSLSTTSFAERNGAEIKKLNYGTQCDSIDVKKLSTVDLKKYYNSNIDDIFKNKYLSPRSPYTTLQIPVQGIGEWCHPQLTAEISDAGFRNILKGGKFRSSIGIPFKSEKSGFNIAYTSLFDNYPDSITIPLSGKASHAYLLMAGSTNHMQCQIANGKVEVTYTDGTKDELILENPYNWCPIEQDYYFDNLAFKTPVQRPYRVHLRTGLVSRDLGKELKITGVYGRDIPDGAAEILDLKLDPTKELQSISIITLSNDVIIGLASLTLQKP